MTVQEWKKNIKIDSAFSQPLLCRGECSMLSTFSSGPVLEVQARRAPHVLLFQSAPPQPHQLIESTRGTKVPFALIPVPMSKGERN